MKMGYGCILKWKKIIMILTAFSLMLLVMMIEKQLNGNPPSSSTSGVNMHEWSLVLNRYASEDGWIMLSLIDMGYIDMAVNFYRTSLQPFNITNYLFIALNKQSCEKMHLQGIHCYMYKKDKSAGVASLYRSKDFLRKMNIRIYAIIDALNLGYSVLHTDIDMKFLQNPWVHFDYKDILYDIAPLWDSRAWNAGFIFIRNSNASRALYDFCKKIVEFKTKVDDQKALNRAINKVRHKYNFLLKGLNRKQYLSGMAFWEDKKVHFAGDFKISCPSDCPVVVHNNWIVSMEAKIYCFKELHWWIIDDKGYYTSIERRYLTYRNPTKFKNAKECNTREIDALKNAFAFAKILKRTLILPQFHCGKKCEKCDILSKLQLIYLNKAFPDYRESTFLDHPLVPDRVKNSSPMKLYHITSSPEDAVSDNLAEVIELIPRNLSKGPEEAEILKWFDDNEDTVLRFHSLYNSFAGFTNPGENKLFREKVRIGFKEGTYRQIELILKKSNSTIIN